MKPHMFYRQSELFVQYLYKQDNKKFQNFIETLLKKKSLKSTFETFYKESLTNYFKRFKTYLKEQNGTM